MSQWKQASTGVMGGLNEDENPAALGDGELTIAQNIARYGDMVGTRPGLVRPGTSEDYDAALADAAAIQGMFEYRQNFDEGRQLLAVSSFDPGGGSVGSVMYNDSAALPAGPTITLGADNLWIFATHNNLAWGAGGALNDGFWHWDGNTANAPVALAVLDSAAATLSPKFVIAWRQYLLINGLRGGVLADNNPASTRYLEFGEDPTAAASWPV